MGRILIRKLALLFVLVPLLHMLGYAYGQRVSAQLLGSIQNVVVESTGSISGGSASLSTRQATADYAFFESYGTYAAQVLSGDLGTVAGTPLVNQLARPVLNSVVLVGIALLLTLLLGFPIGIAAISRRTSRVGPVATFVLTAGSSLPSYLFGAAVIMILISISRYGYRPIREILPWQGFGFDQHLILPTLALAIRPIFYTARVVAGLIEDEFQHDYVRTARSKGVPWSGLLWRHALPNVIGQVLVAIGQAMRIVAGQLIVIEALFDWPGIGRMLLQAIGVRTDAAPPPPFFGSPELLATAAVLFGAFLLVTDLIAHVLAHHIDPRLRHPATVEATA